MRRFERYRCSLLNRFEIYSAIVSASIIYGVFIDAALNKFLDVSAVGLLLIHLVTMVFCLWLYPVMIRTDHRRQKVIPYLIWLMTFSASVFYLIISVKIFKRYMPPYNAVFYFSIYALIIFFVLIVYPKRLFRLCYLEW